MNRIKELRLAAGLTQEQLATMIGSSKPYISQLETGNRDIKQIRQDTMQRICAALNCNSDDLIIKTEFEHDENGFLIVDCLYHDPRFPGHMVAEINGEYFMLPIMPTPTFNTDKTTAKYLKPLATKVSPNAEEEMDFCYVMHCCVPRRGFKIELKRAITNDELAEFRKKYDITDDDITKNFQAQKGALFGSYVKTYTAVQVRIKGGINPLSVESELNKKGIEADACTFDRVNIRVQ